MEKKEFKGEKKMTYEQLNKVASDLHVQYQKLAGEYRNVVAQLEQAKAALDDRDFGYMSFFTQMLFKVMDRPEMYNDKFVKWASETIESLMSNFAASMNKSSGEEKEDVNTDGQKNEA